MAKADTRARKPATITVTLSADVPILQTIPDVQNAYKLQNQALVTLVRVAQGADAYYALEAAKFLLEYATNEAMRREAKRAALEVRPDQRTLPERQAILAELKGLYDKALPRTLIVEAEPEAASSPLLPGRPESR